MIVSDQRAMTHERLARRVEVILLFGGVSIVEKGGGFDRITLGRLLQGMFGQSALAALEQRAAIQRLAGGIDCQ